MEPSTTSRESWVIPVTGVAGSPARRAPTVGGSRPSTTPSVIPATGPGPSLIRAAGRARRLGDVELVDHRRGEVPEHRRGRRAAEAVTAAGRRLVDRHQDGDLRVLGGQEADEAGVVGLLAVGGGVPAVLLGDEAGAGLA